MTEQSNKCIKQRPVSPVVVLHSVLLQIFLLHGVEVLFPLPKATENCIGLQLLA